MSKKKVILTFIATVLLTRVFIFLSVRLDPDATRIRGENLKAQYKQMTLNRCVKTLPAN